ncbi:methyltransferase domain-containing protein [Goodfellowiella coeruleoviolacea]|uniref:Methyltransferase domain-containing protein n=1 Tax=Goodfellowiella coeruleoviolacea TaxID=334858 RepID=A0AAE3KM63_9PSEU|nr:methyltransferase domain-containing protein [Goodfellowiella coeruleoviolacea]MCP2167228.1 Methyltransferase domain-containing protein [Goodfellowiella coeruleoviolacea]
MTATAFDRGLRGEHCALELATGERVALPIARWHAAPGAGDRLLLARCTGPTLDVGCGPGRLTAALTARGVAALGVDISPVAVRLTRARGGIAVCRDVFGALPGAGRWRHVLLADGNIGIGGDPVRLLRRVAALLAGGGTVVAEVDEPGVGLRPGPVRLAEADGWFPWAWLGADAVPEVAAAAGLAVRWAGRCGARWFAELERAR